MKEELLLTRRVRAIGNPPVKISLWDGQEISNRDGNTVARVLVRDRGALLTLITDRGTPYARPCTEVTGKGWKAVDYQQYGINSAADRRGGAFCPVARFMGAASGADERAIAAQEIEFEMNEEQCDVCRVAGDTRNVVLDRWFLRTRQADMQKD